MITCNEAICNWDDETPRWVCRAERNTYHLHGELAPHIEPLPDGAVLTDPDATGCREVLESIEGYLT